MSKDEPPKVSLHGHLSSSHHWWCNYLPRVEIPLLCCFLLVVVAGCRTAPRAPQTDPGIVTAASAARLAFDHGKTAQAVTLYTRALTRARVIDDPAEIANNAYNLAACLAVQGRWHDAELRLMDAGHGARRADLPQTEILLLRAQIAQRAGREADAGRWLQASRAAAGSQSERLQADALEAEMAMAQGEWDRVHTMVVALERALRRGHHDVLLRARVDGLAGRLSIERGAPLDAAASFDQQAARFHEGGQPGDMARALGAAASQYALIEDWAATWDRAYRSGRSLLAQGHAGAALRQVPLALKAAEQLGHPDSDTLTADLFAAIDAALAQKISDSDE